MAGVGGEFLASDCIPDFGSFIEAASADAIAIGNIEAHAIDSILMPLEGVDEVARGGVPELAGSVVAASDKLVAVLIEAAVSERQDVPLQFLDELELLLSLFLYFLDEL